jgi:hypothetical protein
MLGITETAEAATSALHITSLSVAVSHLAANDPLSAWNITLVGCACVVVLALVTSLCELIRWRVRRYIRRRELTEPKPEARRLEG